MSADDQMPDRLGPYRLLDRIGEGGMGVVYLARDADQNAVAVKMLRPGLAAEPNALRRLAREVETMRRVRSPFVAEVIDAELAGDMPYIVTRYVPGHTLDQVIAGQGPLRGAALAGLARGLAGALAAVHAAGVVHRDLKPSNVMLAGDTPVVIDFGIAQGPDASRLTMSGMFMGTPGYLSPEVIEGQPSSEASDVHAWGATVAFAATGRPPFGTGSYENIFYKIVNGQPDLDGAPATLLPLLAAALARDPAHRPPAIQLSALAAVLNPDALVPGPAVGGPQLADASAQATRADAGHGAAAGLAAGVLAGDVFAADGGRPVDAMPGAAAPAGQVLGGAPGGGAADGFAGGGMAAGANGAAAGLASGGAAGAGMSAAGMAGMGAGGAVAGAAAAARLAAEALGAGQAGPAGYGPAGYGAARHGPAGYGAAGSGAVPGYRPGTRPIAAGQRPADFADILPPVGYQPGPPSPGAPPGAETAGPGLTAVDSRAVTASPRGHTLLAVTTMVILACASVLLPVAGTAAALAAVALLRAGGSVRRGAVLRRSTRGARASDPLVAAVSFPWFLFRAVTGLLLLAPFAAATGALAAGLTMIAEHVDRLPHAIAYGAGAMVLYYGLGPGSARPRGQLSHLYARITRTRMVQAAALIAVVALAAGAAIAAVSFPPLYSPVQPPASFVHLGYGPLGGARLLHTAGRILLARLRGW